MLTHDQNEIKTDLTEKNQMEGEDTTSETVVEATEPETEPTEETMIEDEQTQADEVIALDEQTEPETTQTEETLPEEEPAEEETLVPAEEEALVPEEEETLIPEEEEALVPAEEEIVETAVETITELAEEPNPEAIEATIPEPVAELEIPETPKIELSQEELEHNKMLSMYDEYTSSFSKGQIKEGTVVGITDREVSVAIGFKSDGVIPIHEFAYTGIPELNSSIQVFINEVENGEGKLSLSKKKADFIINIERIKKAHEDGTIVHGAIRRRVKGGMIVDIMGIEAFMPGSQMSLKPIPNLDQFIGKEMSFKVVNIDEEHRNIILSRKQVLEDEANIKRQELLSKIQIDSELDGEVKNITQYGAFIDLGGIDGLLHLTDMSWGKINHPSEMLNIGDKVKVKVINFDPETHKISLGLKQLVPHPWETIEIKYPEGTRVTGKVVSVKSFGAFIEIEPGVEGLVHISEMSWTKKISDARKISKLGDTVNSIVLELDKENKRISLGMKQMDPNPWLTIEDRYPIGTVLIRKVKSLTAFGAFVEIEAGIDGLIHISDVSWTKRVYHPRETYRKGQDVEAVILSIDRALHRIALGVKQLSPDPWESLNSVLPVNTEVKGKISKLIPKGVLVDIPLGNDVVEGFIPISHLAIPKLEHSEDAFFVGEEIPLKVIELDMDNRRLILSVKAFFFSRDPRLQEEYIAIHEQYLRDRITRQQKKKADRAIREKKIAEFKSAPPETAETQETIAIDMETGEDSPLVEEPIMAETIVEETAVVETLVEDVVVDETEVGIPEETVVEEPVVEVPVIEETVVEETVVEETVVEETVVEEIAFEEPVVEETVVEKTVVEETVVEVPVIEETVVEETVVEEIAFEEPVIEETLVEDTEESEATETEDKPTA